MARRTPDPRNGSARARNEPDLFGSFDEETHDTRDTDETGDASRPGTTSVATGPAGEPEVEVRRSSRRRRTVSAYRDGERTVVLIPARMSRADERRWVAAMLERLADQDRRRRPGDADLLKRAGALSRRHLDGRARPVSVRWVGNQGSRWGSCTPADGTIRLSSRLQGMPTWVVDYVLVHELAHLIVSSHGPEFWAEVGRYPRTERARGYLEGVAAAAGLQPCDDEPDGRPDDRAPPGIRTARQGR